MKSCFRYFSIVHFSTLESIEESTIIIITRGFVIILSLISTFTEDLKHGINFAYLTNQPLDKGKIAKLVSVNLALLADLVFLILTQISIENFKRSEKPVVIVLEVPRHDENSEDIENNSINDQCVGIPKSEDCLNTNNKTLRFVALVFIIGIAILLIWVFIGRGQTSDPFVGRLKAVVFIQFFLKNVVLIFLIMRNDLIYKFSVSLLKQMFQNKIDDLEEVKSTKKDSNQSRKCKPKSKKRNLSIPISSSKAEHGIPNRPHSAPPETSIHI